MKIYQKKLKIVRGHYFFVIGIFFIVTCVLSAIFISRTARAGIASDDKFHLVMPFFTRSTRGTNVYMEIAQVGAGPKGNGNRLDAGTSWAKYYIDPARIDEATVGIFAGGYGGSVDSLGFNNAGAGKRFNDTNAVRYDFYLGINSSIRGIDEETPCIDLRSGEYVSASNVTSGQMPVDGWYKKAASDFKSRKCNAQSWGETKKSGKYVLFVRATWASQQPSDGNGKLGRLNAFKVGAAYTNSANNLDNPLTGYWSDFDAAYSISEPDRAAYSLQDRLTQDDNAQGDYTFYFGADCRMAPGEKEQRFIHWKDVDYPDYYGEVGAIPQFDLYKIDKNGRESLVPNGDVRYNKRLPNGTFPFNGAGQENRHNYLEFTGEGGYTYKWVWKNIIRTDGVSFWLPYDDYPALVGGCGDYKHELQMKAGQDAATNTSDFTVEGDHKVVVNLTQLWSSKTGSAGPNSTVQLKLAPKAGSSRTFSDSFDGLSATLGGHTVATGASRTLQWPSEADKSFPRLGPQPTYASSRPDIYAYFNVKQNAPDGAQYCLTASMSPSKNSDDSNVKVTPGSICFTIKNSLKPYLTTSGADVHAGDCNRSGVYPMEIKGTVSPVRGSSGSYLVSAGGAIQAFGSGGDANGSNLNLGKGGKYGKMCRPGINDLLDSINSEIRQKKVQVIDVDGANFDLGDPRIVKGGRYLVKFAGSPSDTITGRSQASVTVYSPGTLTIASGFGSRTDVQAAKDKLPVVGVIAQNIKIAPTVGTIDATLYAVDNLDTCAGGSVASCKTKLTLNGFAMANKFAFKRTTGANGLNEAEVINFKAAFYLNPSTGFNIPASDVKYLGERAPLY